MELIKKIKEAENQAKETVEKARQDAIALSDGAKNQRADLFKQAQKRRGTAIDAAVAAAEQSGQSQIAQLDKEGDESVSSLKASSSAKMQGCIDKVLSRLQQV